MKMIGYTTREIKKLSSPACSPKQGTIGQKSSHSGALDVYGDDIVLDGTLVARFVGVWPTLRDLAQALIEGAELGAVSEADHCEAVDDARREGYEEGKSEALDAAKEELCSNRDKIFNEGYDAGRAAALADMERAQDVKRVGDLVHAVSVAHDSLFQIVAQRYPAAKLGDLKRQAISSLSDIRIAINKFQAPNGAYAIASERLHDLQRGV
jgi:hypothetical protein